MVFRHERKKMEIEAIIHRAEEGGYWAEVPAIPGCATEGETLDELRTNLREAIEACLSVDEPWTWLHPISATHEQD